MIHGATYSNNVPEQSCQLTTTNGCDSVAFNLIINNNSSSSEDVTVCDSYDWNGITYTIRWWFIHLNLALGCDSLATINQIIIDNALLRPMM